MNRLGKLIEDLKQRVKIILTKEKILEEFKKIRQIYQKKII